MNDSLEQPNMSDEQKNTSSPVPVGQRSPVVLITTSAVGMQEHIKHDSPEPSSLLHERETASSPMPQILEPGTQPPTEAASPVSQDSNPSQTSPSPSDPTLTFPIMKLPPEIRLMVFDQLFLDLTVRRQHFMKYHNGEKLLQKHQVNDFRPYTNLLLTCKELNKEAKKLWEEQYLHECCFYFWHVSKLYDLAMLFEKLGGAYTNVRYVLRTQFVENFVCNMCLAATAAEAGEHEALWFMQTQPVVSPDYSDEFDQHFIRRLFPSTGNDSGKIEIGEGVYEATDENPVRTVVYKEAGKTFAHGEYSGPESCSLSTHLTETVLESTNHDNNNELQIYVEGRGARHDVYEQMQGKFSGIFWGGYDPAVGYGKLKLWEAVPLLHLESRCLCRKWNDPANRHDEEDDMLRRGDKIRSKLLDKWFNEIINDPKWLALGGEVDEEGLSGVLDDYGMEHWNDAEYWEMRADENWSSMRLSASMWHEVETFHRKLELEEAFYEEYQRIMRERGEPIEY
jgi:hypothetical protein